MQNIVLLMEPSYFAYDISLKAGNMLLNRFFVDENAAFESSGVFYLYPMDNDIDQNDWNQNWTNVKGMRKSYRTEIDIFN